MAAKVKSNLCASPVNIFPFFTLQYDHHAANQIDTFFHSRKWCQRVTIKKNVSSRILWFLFLNSQLIWWHHQMETFFALLALCAGNSPVNSPHKDQWRGALMLTLICAWRNCWVNNCKAGDFRHHRAHYDVTVMDLVCVTHNIRSALLMFQNVR